MSSTSPAPTVILYDETARRWLRFSDPETVLTTTDPQQVTRLLEELASQVEDRGRCAAGFLSYSAAPALDPRLPVIAGMGFPLLWFGIYREPVPVEAPAVPDSPPRIDWTPTVSEADYRAAIRRVREYIRAGDSYQVNYTYRLTAPLTGEPWDLFRAMIRAQGNGLGAWIDFGDWCICSASHELFFRLDGEVLSSRPMKGTAPRGRTLADDNEQAAGLGCSAKNRAENLMIVDMVRNDMGRVAETGSVQVMDLFKLERYPTLWQMTSTVQSRTRASIPSILRALFPCASITGAPKKRAMEIIAELESTPRDLYTGAIGWLGPGRRAQFNVAIRTLVADRLAGHMTYGTGGGIVWDSEAGDELRESLDKARIVTRGMPEFELLETLLWTPEEGCYLLEAHLARLLDSAEYFSRVPERDRVATLITEHTRNLPRIPHRLRVLVDGQARVRVESASAPPAPRLARVCLARMPVDAADVFLYHKTTHRRVYRDALAACPGFDDVLLWNRDRQLTESTIANLVVELDGDLVTPPVACGLLPGIERAELLRTGRIRERSVDVDELPHCTRIWLVNSVRGMWPAELVTG